MLVLGVLVLGGVVAFAMMPKSTPATDVPATELEVETTETGTDATQLASNEVTIQNFAFGPATVTVKVGDTVTWTNMDLTGHSATADDGSFDTGVLSQGKSGSVTFDTAGTFTYHCTPHPNMKGTVVVE